MIANAPATASTPVADDTPARGVAGERKSVAECLDASDYRELMDVVAIALRSSELSKVVYRTEEWYELWVDKASPLYKARLQLCDCDLSAQHGILANLSIADIHMAFILVLNGARHMETSAVWEATLLPWQAAMCPVEIIGDFTFEASKRYPEEYEDHDGCSTEELCIYQDNSSLWLLRRGNGSDKGLNDYCTFLRYCNDFETRRSRIVETPFPGNSQRFHIDPACDCAALKRINAPLLRDPRIRAEAFQRPGRLNERKIDVLSPLSDGEWEQVVQKRRDLDSLFLKHAKGKDRLIANYLLTRLDKKRFMPKTKLDAAIGKMKSLPTRQKLRTAVSLYRSLYPKAFLLDDQEDDAINQRKAFADGIRTAMYELGLVEPPMDQTGGAA